MIMILPRPIKTPTYIQDNYQFPHFLRHDKLEETMKEEGLSEDQKQEKRQQHAQKETEFLRLKRSRLGVEDFEALKVIGRGAFGEVRSDRALSSQN